MNKYLEWLRASEDLKTAKAKELQLRNALCDELLSEKLEGSLTVRDQGYKITATAKLTRSIDQAVLESIWDNLPDEERECIAYKPSLKLANYKRIEQQGGLLMEAITVKPAQASLKIEPIEAEG